MYKTVSWTPETINYYNDLLSNGFELQAYLNLSVIIKVFQMKCNILWISPSVSNPRQKNTPLEYIFIMRTIVSLCAELQKKKKKVVKYQGIIQNSLINYKRVFIFICFLVSWYQQGQASFAFLHYRLCPYHLLFLVLLSLQISTLK